MTVTRLVARPLLASMFVVGGINSLRNASAMAPQVQPVADKLASGAQKAQVPLPKDAQTQVKINGAIHVVAGLALATGRAPRLSSAVLAATLVPTTAAGHRFWEETDPGAKANQQVHFFKNASLLGGLLLGAVDTDGKPGVAWRAKRAAGDVRRETTRAAKSARREAKLARAQVG